MSKIPTFLQYLNENESERFLRADEILERVKLCHLGLSDKGIDLLKVSIYWENLGQKSFDGSPMHFMKCWFCQNWPINQPDDQDSWVEFPSREVLDAYLNDREGDVEIVDGDIMRMAEDHGADAIWITVDNTWLDTDKGSSLPDLRKI